MSTERIIHLADLSLIQSALRSIQSDVGVVYNHIDSVGQELNRTRSELGRLEQAFMDFVQSDLKAKALSLAETRQVKVRLELETSFGHNATVRRHATGILQASDIQLVRQDTIREATEELMLSTPRYWLAPALVALAAWLSDNQNLAQRALTEAIRRDDEKTSLFFALVSRRAGRAEANRTWLDRYFGLQNPLHLDRQTVVMVDALANGLFSADALMLCSKRIEAWIEELSQQAGFAQTQRSQWSDALRSKTPNFDMSKQYPHLAKLSPTWKDLNTSLNQASMQTMVLDHFEQVFNSEIKATTSMQAAVDDLLTKLVTRYDDEELPLRRQEELCRLIIEEDGDKRAAQARYDLQIKSLDEHIDFTQLLTNAAMHPEASGVTQATQRFAIAHSKAWILDAHSDVTAKARQQVPASVQIDIEDWSDQTHNGDNEAALLQDLSQHLQRREATALEAAKVGLKEWGPFALGAAILVFGIASLGWMALVMALAACSWGYVSYQKVQKARQKIKESYALLQQQSAQALRAALAETVELRRDIAARDSVSDAVTTLLDNISPEQHVLATHNSVRRVMGA